MGTMIRNWWSTIFGVLLGTITYLSQQGANLPSDGKGWTTLLISALLAGLGIVSKDALTGSKPKG